MQGSPAALSAGCAHRVPHPWMSAPRLPKGAQRLNPHPFNAGVVMAATAAQLSNNHNLQSSPWVCIVFVTVFRLVLCGVDCGIPKRFSSFWFPAALNHRNKLVHNIDFSFICFLPHFKSWMYWQKSAFGDIICICFPYSGREKKETISC